MVIKHKECSYVLITPARNEEANIEKTIQSVVSQTVRPSRWIIVNDGSIDCTGEIVRRFVKKHAFMEQIQLPERGERSFSSKVDAFNAGYECIKRGEWSFIGNLDADISFGDSYYEEVLEKFYSNMKLGIAGGSRFDLYDGRCVKIERSRDSVMGAIQLFRRECFEAIDGYMPLEGGGIDAVAEIMARMHGWEIETFPEIIVYHHRQTGTADRGVMKAWFRYGNNDYLIGYHPVFEVLRCIRKMTKRPSGISYGLSLLAGYCWGFVRRRNRVVPDHVIRYLRSEQMKKILSVFRSYRTDWKKT